MSLTATQQRLVRAWGGWPAVDVLATGSRPEVVGGKSAPAWCPDWSWIDYDSKGLVASTTACPCPEGAPHDTCRPTHEVIARLSWGQVARYADTLPTSLRDAMRKVRRQAQRLAMQGHRRFTLGPGYEYMRMGADRDLPAYDHDTWDAMREAAWPLELRASRLIRAEEERLLDLALPLATAEPEPTDLLELLAVMA